VVVGDIEKNHRSKGDFKYSIVIPTWNNLDYLKNCIESFRKHSSFKHQIILLINEGKDGSYEWIQSQPDLDYVYSEKNIGICYGLNICRSLISTEYVLYANDDMYFLPEWDFELDKEVRSIKHNQFMISSTLIEPSETGNDCVIVSDYGDDLETFQEEKLLKEYKSYVKEDWGGTTWPPSLTHIDMWDFVGGMSVEFSPGMYSDPDLAMKLWLAGVRYYKGVGASRVYHYGSKSTGRVKKNLGRKTFVNKWGMSANVFVNKYLRRGQPFCGELKSPKLSAKDEIKNKLKRILNA
jgi:glycosyltransferase involved in cell wall biosynthesis